MEKTQRLVGIDLMKGIAAYSVAVLHAGDVTNSTSVGFWATQMQRFCSFAVPFFSDHLFLFIDQSDACYWKILLAEEPLSAPDHSICHLEHIFLADALSQISSTP